MPKKKPGTPPGSLVYTGDRRTDQVRLDLVNYDKQHCDERVLDKIEDAVPSRDQPSMSWLNIVGLHEPAILESLGHRFGYHPLVLEDILNTHQRPKFEEHDDYLFAVVRLLHYDDASGQIETEQVSLVASAGLLVSFQEIPGDVFHPVRQRIRDGRPRIRGSGSDYLLYALLDTIVDHYFLILEKLGERIEALEDTLMDHPTRESLAEIYRLKRELSTVRKAVWPVRELAAGLERSESRLIRKTTHLFVHDVYDHAVQVIDAAENYREIVSGLLDMYLSSISNRTNDVMKVLTMIATIFIPLSFLAGLYGMNFEHMPELHYPWAYPLLLSVMAVVALGFVIYFKRKNWL